jgi:cysteine-S-conjugate beta-lyase
MQQYDFDKNIDRAGTHSVKWDRYPKDVLPLWVADMDFPSPPEVLSELKKRVEHGIFGYTYPPQELMSILQERMETLYNWNVNPEWFVLTPGVVSGLNLFCHAFSTQSQNVVVQTPVYPPILHAADVTHLHKQEVPLFQTESGRYEIDFDHFETAVSSEPSQFILSNPHNPTGRVFNKTELQQLAEICLHHNVLICSDDIHSDLIFTGSQHTPIASLSKEIEKRTITFVAPSKTFNIAGLGCSVAIISDSGLRKQYSQVRDAYAGHVNALGLTAALAAYRDGAYWLKCLIAYLESNRNTVTDFVHSSLPGVKIYPAEGTYLAWLDCRQLELLPSPCEYFIQEAKVGLNNGLDFGESGRGFVRLNFGCSNNILMEALQRIKTAINNRLRVV